MEMDIERCRSSLLSCGQALSSAHVSPRPALVPFLVKFELEPAGRVKLDIQWRRTSEGTEEAPETGAGEEARRKEVAGGGGGGGSLSSSFLFLFSFSHFFFLHFFSFSCSCFLRFFSVCFSRFPPFWLYPASLNPICPPTSPLSPPFSLSLSLSRPGLCRVEGRP